MGTRGRKSAAQLAIAPQVVEIIPRPVAPGDLTDEQASEWDAVVSRMPADWFPRETHGMLTAYCRHVVAARRVAAMIEALVELVEPDEDESPGAAVLGTAKMMGHLLIMQEREGRAMSSLATRMRLSQQSSYSDKISSTAKRVTAAKKLWES